MAVRSLTAPHTPWSKQLTEPNIHETAYIHSFSNVVGDVRIGSNVLIAPGTSIRADEGGPFYIGDGSNVQDGVVIHGLEQSRILGDDGNTYSVWVGDNSVITHMALIHGPAYVGSHCFIGFRSTVFNARLGHGCIVMMHVLIQDVEIPPGKLVPSGAVITSQQQADRLPDVRDVDRAFVAQVAGMNQALRSGHYRTQTVAPVSVVLDEISQSTVATLIGEGESQRQLTKGESMDSNVISQVRQLLAQGYRIGTEHADERRFQTSSWKSCAPIQAGNESQVLAELNACLNEHSGEYVRLIGIDTKAKRRVVETIIQRPGDRPGQAIGSGTSSQTSSANRFPVSYPTSRSSGSGQSTGGVATELVAQIRNLLAQGARIGMEHADARRFQTSSWTSCSPIQSSREADVIAGVEACLREHPGEYVRLLGIDPKAKRRLAEVIIQRPNGVVPQLSSSGTGGSAGYSAPSTSTSNSSTASHQSDWAAQVSQLMAQGYTVGMEYADERRFRTSSWNNAPAIQVRGDREVIRTVQAFLSEHPSDYVRLVGIDPKGKCRVAEVIIQRPNGKGGTSFSPATPSASTYTATASSHVASATSNGSGRLNGDVANQVRQMLAQGYRISTEYADERRYKTSSWQSGGVIQANRDGDVMAALNAFASEHSSDYVRLVATDPTAKRRVLETIIQKPGKK